MKLNDKGSILVGALLVTALVGILVMPLTSVVNTAQKTSIKEGLEDQAFYMAEAGLLHAQQEVVALFGDDVEAQRIIDNLAEYLDDVLLTVDSTEADLITGKYTVRVLLSQPDPGVNSLEVRLVSTGEAGDPDSTSPYGYASVTVSSSFALSFTVSGNTVDTWDPVGNGSTDLPDFENVAIYARDSLLLEPRTVVGKVLTSATAAKSIKFKSDMRNYILFKTYHHPEIEGQFEILSDKSFSYLIDADLKESGKTPQSVIKGGPPIESPAFRDYRAVPMPERPSLPKKNNISGSATIVLDEEGAHYDLIDLKGGALTIDVGSEVRKLSVNRLKLGTGGRLDIRGSGLLLLYVDSIEGTGPGKLGTVWELLIFPFSNRINASSMFSSEQGNMDQLVIYYYGTGEFKISGLSRINAFFVTEKARVTFDGGTYSQLSVFTGASNTNNTSPAVTITDIGTNTSALIYAPDGTVRVGQAGQLRGSIIAKDVELKYEWASFVRSSAVEYHSGIVDIYSRFTASSEGGALVPGSIIDWSPIGWTQGE